MLRQLLLLYKKTQDKKEGRTATAAVAKNLEFPNRIERPQSYSGTRIGRTYLLFIVKSNRVLN